MQFSCLRGSYNIFKQLKLQNFKFNMQLGLSHKNYRFLQSLQNSGMSQWLFPRVLSL